MGCIGVVSCGMGLNEQCFTSVELFLLNYMPRLRYLCVKDVCCRNRCPAWFTRALDFFWFCSLHMCLCTKSTQNGRYTDAANFPKLVYEYQPKLGTKSRRFSRSGAAELCVLGVSASVWRKPSRRRGLLSKSLLGVPVTQLKSSVQAHNC